MTTTELLRLSAGLSLPINTVTQRLAFLGKPGSGKSYAATKLAELMYDVNAQFVALDPVGIWYGLRMDGKGKGLPIPVFGGLHGDVPLEVGAGAMMADLIVDRRLSCVLDVSQFEHDTEKARFAAAFAARFYFRMKAAPAAVHVFLEECQEFVPQNPQRGEEQMLHDFTRMDKLGRNFGIGMSLITQRPQEVNKKVLNLTECLLAFQMTGAHERKAIKEWVHTVGADENILTILPELEIAHAHVYSPQWLRISETVKVGQKRTADVSSTPAVGVSAAQSKPLAPVDLDQIRTQMAKTIEKAKADDPTELKKEIVALKKQLRNMDSLVADPKTIAHEIEKGLASTIRQHRTELAEQRRGFELILKSTVRLLHDVHRQASDIVRVVGDVQVAIQTTLDAEPHQTVKTPLSRPVARQAPPAVSRDRSTPIPARTEVSDGSISGVGQRILNTIAGLSAMGVTNPDKATVAALVGYHPNAKSYANAMGSLNSGGFVQYLSGGLVTLTTTGEARAENVLPIASVDELHELWFGRLGNIAKKILVPLIKEYPDAVSADHVAGEAGYHPNAKSFANMKGRLRTLGLIDYPASGQIVATKVLFPDGLV